MEFKDTPKARMVKRQLASVEDGRGDFNEFVACMTEDATYQFGNFDPHVTRAGILQGFYDLVPLVKGDFSIVKVGHDIYLMEETENQVLVHMDTVYKVNGEEKMRLPCFAVYTFEGELIKKLQTFLDTSPLFLDTSPIRPHGKAFKTLTSD
jgi:ketosteroid isomerase-like protein